VAKVSQSLPLERRSAASFALSLDLRYLVFPLFIALLVSAPVMRGLFFPADLFPHLLALGAVLLLAAVQVMVRKEEVFHGLMPFAFLWLAASYGLSCFVAATPAEAVRGFLRYLAYFGVFWVASYLSRDSGGKRALALTVFSGATVVALIGLSSATQVFVFPGAASGGRIMSTVQYPNALAAYLMFSSVIGLTLSCVEGNAIVRGALSLATFCQALAFLSSYSRGGWVVYPVTLALMFLGMPKVQRSRLAFHTCTTLTAVLLIVRRFSEAIEGKTPKAAVKYVLFGLAICLSFEAAYALFGKVSSGLLSPSARRALGWAGGVYAAITLAAYLIALAGQYSAGVAGVVSSSMLRRFNTINMDDPSLLTRAFATGDALRIFADHPFLGGGAGAWNAWYHQYQRVLYWTTEVHNHYAQVLVEVGVLGFASYLLVWGGFMFYVVKFMLGARQRGLLEDSAGVAMTWGLAAACLAVGIHSAMDFELSLPGIAVQLWAIFGVVSESTLNVASLGGRRLMRPAPVAKQAGKMNGWVAGTGVALMSLALMIPPYFLQKGAWYGGLGAAALARNDFYTSIKLYEQARRFDPFTASYSMDMGQAYAAMALLERREGAKAQALAEFDEARQLEPFNLTHRLKEIETLTCLGEVSRALSTSQEVVGMLPLDVQVYETFAKLSVVSYMRMAREGSSGEGQDGGMPSGAAALLVEVTGIPAKLEALQALVPDIYREKSNSEKLNPTPYLNMYVGQAYYLEGDLQRAIAFFDKALADKSKPLEAQAWMTATHILAGQMSAVNVSREVAEILSYAYPAAR
jgi:tetratricopeptide (TPR) repeat protein